jgi:Putative adhesin
MLNKLAAFNGTLALLVIMTPWSPAHADKPVAQRVPADAKGTVEIGNLAGSVEVSGWDRAEVEVTGNVEDGVERVDVHSSGSRTSITVVLRPGLTHGGGAHLSIHVPAASAVTATLVSSDLKLAGVRGDVKLQTVSGNLSGDVGGDVRASTVSGSVQLNANDARRMEIKTISGDVHVSGGGGEVELTTVSGSAKAELGSLARGRFKTVSGDVVAKLTLAPDGQLDGESVSGGLTFDFGSDPKAAFDVQSFSGEIQSCFGPAPEKPRYGPGSRLSFDTGGGQGRVHIDTKSGDVKMCAPGAREKKAVNRPTAFATDRGNAFYVL